MDFLSSGERQDELLSNWAYNMLNYISSVKEVENQNLLETNEELGPLFLEWLG